MKDFIEGISIVLTFFLFYVLCKWAGTIDGKITDYQVNLGKEVVVYGEKVMILDYQFLGNDYVLSNGVKADANLIKIMLKNEEN